MFPRLARPSEVGKLLQTLLVGWDELFDNASPAKTFYVAV